MLSRVPFRHGSAPRTGFFISAIVVALLLSASALHAQGVGKSGSTTPPGCANAIDWRVVAQKNLIPPGQPGGSSTLTTWVQFRNTGAFDCDFVFCYMLDLLTDRKMMPVINIGKSLDRTRWQCSATGRQANAPPNFHFGCVRVSVPARAGRGQPGDPPIVVAPFERKADRAKKGLQLKSTVQMGQMFTADQLGSVYMDFLKDCELSDDCQLCSADTFLVPAAPEGFSEWVNVWVGGAYFRLDEQILSASDWPLGNWVTMGDEERDYPALLIGELTGAPPGTVILLQIGDDTPLEFEVEGDENTCSGSRLALEAPYFIPADDNNARAFIDVRLPEGPCGQLEEGQAIRFSGQVVADQGVPVYMPGDSMFTIEQVFTKDSQPPDVLESTLLRRPDRTVEVRVVVADEGSSPATVNILRNVGLFGAEVTAAGVTAQSLQESSNVLEFSAILGPFSPGTLLNLEAQATDEAENAVIVPIGSIEVLEDLAFAQFGSGTGFRSEVVLTNLGTQPASGTVAFRDGAGAPLQVEVEGLGQTAEVEFLISPRDSATISTAGTEEELALGSASALADQPLSGVVRFNIPQIGIAGVGAGQPLMDFITPVRNSSDGIRTALAVRNLSAQEAEVSCQLLIGGEVADQAELALSANGRIAQFIDEIMDTLDGGEVFSGTVACSSNQFLAAIALELGPQPGQFTTLPVAPLEQ